MGFSKLPKFKKELSRIFSFRKNIWIINSFFFTYFFVDDLLMKAFPLYIKHLGISSSWWGYILSGGSLIGFFLIPPIGALADKHGRKPILFLSLSLAGLTLVGIMVSPYALIIVGLMALIPITRSINNITVNPLLAHTESQEERGFVFGVRDVFLHSGAALGTFAGGWFLAASYSGSSFRHIFLIALLFLFFTGLIVYFFDEKTQNTTGDEFKEGLLASFKEINDKKSLLILSLLQVFRGFYPPLIAFIPILGAEIGLKSSHIMYVIASSTGVTALLSLVGGKLSDLLNRKKMYLTDIFFDILILFALIFARNIYVFGLGLGLIAINSIFYANINAYIYDLFEDGQASRAVSVLSSTAKLTGVFAPAIIGFLWGIDRKIALGLGILGSGAALLVGMYLLPESEKDLARN